MIAFNDGSRFPVYYYSDIKNTGGCSSDECEEVTEATLDQSFSATADNCITMTKNEQAVFRDKNCFTPQAYVFAAPRMGMFLFPVNIIT